eukprot:1437355-Prymnesium_polylepis.1
MAGLDCKPSVAKLADCLPPLAPRLYSISNAAAADKGKVHLCLCAASRFELGTARGSRREPHGRVARGAVAARWQQRRAVAARWQQRRGA